MTKKLPNRSWHRIKLNKEYLDNNKAVINVYNTPNFL